MALPQYAQRIPSHLRVQIICRDKCGMGRYAEANMTRGDAAELDEAFLKHKAKCGMCGYEAIDHYNWIWS